MSTKICPNCENSVPAVANLCKHCAHDFNTPVVQARSPWLPLGALALGTGLVAVWAFATMRDAHKGSTVFLDEETKRVVVIETYPDRREATQVPFGDVASLEYVKNGTPHPFEFAIVSKSDQRFVVSAGESSLDPKVKQYEQALGKTAVVKGDIDVSKLAE